jgi:hypothetical protein
MRLSKPGINSQQLQNELLAAIRAEYNIISPNRSISRTSRGNTQNARNATIHLINATAESLKKEALT